MNALDIIKDAFERCNRLSPGETLGADDIDLGFRRLNLLADELSVQNVFLFKSTLTSSAQSGHITLGAGAWEAIKPGTIIVSATADDLEMRPVTMAQYNAIYDPGVTGLPSVWAQDGLSAVYLYPVPTGQTIKLLTRAGVKEFADLPTDYAVPDGYRSALGAALAVRIAPNIIGGASADLLRAERRLMNNISRMDPKIIDVHSYSEKRYPTAEVFFSGQ